MTLLLLPLMVVAFYFLLIRPQRKRAAQQQKLLSEMVPGERVVTHSGIFGTLVSSGTKQSVLQIAPGLEITVLKQAIARVVRPEDEDGLTELEDEVATDDQVEDTESVENLESGGAGTEYDAYRPSEPSSLDLPELDAVDEQGTPPSTPQASASSSSTSTTASTGGSQPGIRDVTSSYLKRPETSSTPETSTPATSTPELSEPGHDTESETGHPTKDS